MAKKIYRSILFIVLFLAFAIFPANTIRPALAEPIPPTIGELGIEIGTDVITDNFLYKKLVAIYNNYYNLTGTDKIIYVYSRMFAEIDFSLLNNTLDLSGTPKITNLTGLNNLDFKSNTTLKTLDLSYNSITTISAIELESFKTIISTLNISNNNLSSIDLSLFINLHTLYANNNSLRAIDVSKITNTNLSGIGEINLAQNSITQFNDIVLPRDTILSHNIHLNIINNTIKYIPDDLSSKFLVNVGLVGTSTENKFNTSGTLLYKKLNSSLIDIPNIELKIMDKETLEEITSIDNELCEDNVDIISLLGIGNYIATYFSNNEAIQNKDDWTKSYFKNFEFSILPTPPTYKIEINGELKELSEIGQLNQRATLKFYTIDSTSKIFYKYGGDSEWHEANELALTQGGNYSIQIKTVVDDVSSEITTIQINARTNLDISDGILMLIIVASFIILFFVLFPLVRKYILQT